ncbi:MAG: hypothetical protein IPM97_03350 [Bdellovibrionaceae bacterium]|nr:hypothetical protein [Pseudobdellovibrionaceae bacterium]
MLKLLPLLLISSVSFAGSASILKMADDIPKDQQTLIQSDLNRLAGMSFVVSDEKFSKVLDFNGPVRSDTMLGWLSERIKYVVRSDFAVAKAAYIENERYEYQNPRILPTLPDNVKPVDEASVADDKKVMTVMTNIGGVLYIAGKQMGSLLGLNIPGIGKVPSTSPRVGILQIGPGLFAARRGDKVGDPQSIDASLNRLGTLFHEARHSDGNGANVGMLHIACPAGHAYAGYAACDFSLNGSYSVGGHAIKVLGESCTSCTVSQKEALRLRYLDSFSRVISEIPDKNASSQEKYLKVMADSCEIFRRNKVEIPKEIDCKKIDAQIAGAKHQTIKAQYLDSKPEGFVEKRR